MEATFGADTVEVSDDEIHVTISGTLHRCSGFRAGMADERETLAAALSFLAHAAEEMAYAHRKRGDPWEDPDSGVHLFPRAVVEWADGIGSDYLANAAEDLPEED